MRSFHQPVKTSEGAMNCSWKAIRYWIMLWVTFLLGVVFTARFFPLLIPQKNFQLNEANATGLAIGLALLLCSAVYFQNRKLYPLKKPKTNWRPIKIELNTDIDGQFVSSPIRLIAVQKNSASDSNPKDYRIKVYNIKTRKVVRLDRSIGDHEKLYQNFLTVIHGFEREFLPKPYSSRWNIVADLAKK
jgi:hypothetical protein